jgi:hypothetical protein
MSFSGNQSVKNSGNSLFRDLNRTGGRSTQCLTRIPIKNRLDRASLTGKDAATGASVPKGRFRAGSPPGNKKTMKHGVYQAAFTSEEKGERQLAGIVEIKRNVAPRRTISNNCIDCVGGASMVRDCQGDKLFDGPCLFYRYRMGRRRLSVRLIRKHCLWCMGGNEKLVRECPSKTCPFLPYRMGKNPQLKGRKISKGLSQHRFKPGERPRSSVNSSPESMQDHS